MSNFSAQSLYNLEGAVALVTGGGTGIGLMAAKALAANGAKVYISGRREAVLNTACEVHGSGLSGSLHPVKSDVSSKEEVQAMAKYIDEKEGKLHILINNAGIEGPVTHLGPDPKSLSAKKLSEMHLSNESTEDWTNVFKTNTTSLFFCSMAMLPLLEKGNESPPKGKKSGKGGWSGTIINITSISGVVKMAQDHYAYNASKGAANHLTQLLSHTLSFHSSLRIRVNALLPGLFATEMTAGPSQSGVNSTENLPHVNPAERVGEDVDMANAILFLATNAFTTGQLLAIDGGFIASR